MASELTELVKSRVTVPMYFYSVIVPQMADYYSDYTVDFEIKPVAKCPLHDEETPSMRYYEETNTFFCWGCRAGGDVIQLHRKFAERMSGDFVPFDAAVRFLNDYFIVGKEVAQVFQVKAKKEELNTINELVRLGIYIKGLDLAIQSDTSMALQTKKELWRLIDDVQVIISLQMMRAPEALELLKNSVIKIVTTST